MTHFNFNQSLTNFVNNLKGLFILSLTLTTFGVGNVWGLDQYVTVTDFNSSTTYSEDNLDGLSGGKKSNHVTFGISGVSYKNAVGVKYLTYGDVSANSSKTSSFTWNTDNNYSVKVTEVSIKLRGYQAKISPKTANAQFSDGTTSGTQIDCKTNSVGNGGTKEVKISNTNGIKSPLTLTMSTGGNKAEYTIPEVKYTYQVTHKEYLFGFSANAEKNIDGGTISASVQNATVQAAVGITSASTTATYSVTVVNAGYGFVGWYSDSNYTNLVSTETSCQQTINNSTAGSTANKTLYAKFAPLPYFYFKAQAGKVGTGNVYASFTDGSYSATSDVKTERATTLAQSQSTGTYTAYFKAEETDAAYHFAGWYTDAACTEANRVSTNLSYSEQISGSTATTEAGAKTITRYAKFVQELTPEVTANYSGSPKAMFVDDEISSAFSFLNTSTFGSGFSVVSSNDNIIVYDVANNKVIAKNEGTATLTFTQIKQEIIKAGEFSFTFAVSKITNTLAADATHSMKVDETWTSVISGKNSDATVTTTSSDETVAYYDVTNDKIVAQNTGNQSFNSKVVTITISQAATYKYTAVEKTIKVTVKKHVPTFTWSNATLYHNQTYNDFFTTTGTNALSVKSSSDADVAYFVDGTNAQKLNLKTLTKAASTTLTITQAENYYWAEHTESKTITPNVAPNHVPFTYNEAMFNDGNITITKAGTNNIYMVDNGRYVQLGEDATTVSGGDAWKDKYIIIKFNGIPDKVSFQYATSSGSATSSSLGAPPFRVEQSSDNKTYTEIYSDSRKSSSWSETITRQLNKETRYLKFFYGGNFGGQYQYITVTELKTFSTDKSELDFGDTNKKDMPCADQTFTFNYANVGHKVSLSTSDNHFSVSPTSITNIGGEKYGSQTITVSYRTDEVHSTTNAKLTIKDELGNTKEVTLKGTTTKKVQTLTWNEPYDVAEPTIPIGKEITGAVTSSSNLGIIYESSDETIIEIAEDGKSFKAVKEGSATITAKQVGTDDWEAASTSKLFKTTNKIIQVISWNQNFTRLLTNYDSQDLTAKVYLVNAETGEQTYSKDRSDLISYSSQNTSVVSIENTTYGPRLSIIGKGSTTLTASVPGDDLYESATVTIPVTVRDPSAGCEDVLLPTDLTSEYEFWHFSYTSDMEKIVKIDRSSADYPGKMKFQHKGEKWGLSYSGNIDVYESTDNGATFPRYLGSVSPSVGNYQRSQEFALSRNATHLKFYRNEHATGYHYIKDIEIIPAQFIESDAVNNTIDFGNVTVNSVEERTVTLSYANVKDNLTITKSSSYLTLSCGDIVDLDCGATGKETITITFSPKAVGDFNDDITFLDKISKQNYAINIKAKVVKSTQHITWEPTQTEYRTIDQIVLNATASSNNPVKYSVKEGADVADFVDNVLTIKKDGQVTITASEPGDAVWAAAVEVNKTFTIRKTNLHFEPLPTAATITYPQTLSESALTDGVVKDEDGNVIAGTIVWTNLTTQLNAGDNQTQDITFTPANNPAWYSSLSTAISLNVQKAVSDATPSAADVTYGQKVDESILSNTGSTTGTWTWTDSRSADVLTAGVYTDLQVHFTPENNNYTELDATVSLTVNKAQPVISWTGETTYEWGEIANLFSASNDAAVTMTSSNEAVAKIEDNKIIPVSAGTVTIHGEIEENDNYLAASLDQTITINAPADNMFTNAAGDNDWNNPSNWTSGIVPEKLNDVDVIVSGEMTIDEEIHVNSLTIESGASVKVVVNGDLTVQGQSQERIEYGDLFVKNGGEVILPEGNSRKMMVHNLVIESSIGTSNGTSTSGQISNLEALAFDNGGDAYIDINLDPSGNADDSQWYCFTVPFPVDITTGIARKELDGSFKVLQDHTNFDILRYNPTQRLNTGKGWEYYHGTLQPGEFYLIAIDGTNNVYSFRKKKDADLISANTMSLAVNGDNTNVNANWNAVGNPTLQKVTASFSNKIVQVYVNGESRYQAVSTDNANFVVGCPFFIQASVAENLTLTADNSKSLFYAPARQDDNTNTLFCVRFGQNNHFSDQIFVTASEQALNQYEIGYDVAKIGVSKQSAQLWVNAYNQQLCAHEAVLTNDLADMALTLFAPKAGEYNLSVARENMPTDETLYLTQNGQIIWNLSESDYTIEAAKGDNNQYGLRLISSHRITTDNEQLESRNRAEKFIMNNQLYILRDGQLYDATGKKIQ